MNGPVELANEKERRLRGVTQIIPGAVTNRRLRAQLQDGNKGFGVAFDRLPRRSSRTWLSPVENE